MGGQHSLREAELLDLLARQQAIADDEMNSASVRDQATLQCVRCLALLALVRTADTDTPHVSARDRAYGPGSRRALLLQRQNDELHDLP